MSDYKQTLKKLLLTLTGWAGRLWSYLCPHGLVFKLKYLSNVFYSGWISRKFKHYGAGTILRYPLTLRGVSRISIGRESSVGENSALTVWEYADSGIPAPEIVIGSGVSIGVGAHITAINRIEIGDNVLIGKTVTITDNAHGKSDAEAITLPPIKRRLYSPGPVIIESGVWVGDKVTILPNVRIGKNSIIGANSVVTKDIPPNCVAAGVPARVVKDVGRS